MDVLNLLIQDLASQAIYENIAVTKTYQVHLQMILHLKKTVFLNNFANKMKSHHIQNIHHLKKKPHLTLHQRQQVL